MLLTNYLIIFKQTIFYKFQFEKKKIKLFLFEMNNTNEKKLEIFI